MAKGVKIHCVLLRDLDESHAECSSLPYTTQRDTHEQVEPRLLEVFEHFLAVRPTLHETAAVHTVKEPYTAPLVHTFAATFWTSL